MSDEVDALYALPLEEFTAARNALAKKLGSEEIRKLAKPSVPAWAVNQLARRERKQLGELLKSGEALQKQVLGGKAGPAAMREAQQHERQLVRELVQQRRGAAEGCRPACDGGRPGAHLGDPRRRGADGRGARSASLGQADRGARAGRVRGADGADSAAGVTTRRAGSREACEGGSPQGASPPRAGGAKARDAGCGRRARGGRSKENGREGAGRGGQGGPNARRARVAQLDPLRSVPSSVPPGGAALPPPPASARSQVPTLMSTRRPAPASPRRASSSYAFTRSSKWRPKQRAARRRCPAMWGRTA